jgi:hypothetical protein
MIKEKQEHHATQEALDEIANWMRPPAQNEGINYSVARLGAFPTGPASFLGGGDASIFTPSGHRGTLASSVDGSAVETPDFVSTTTFPIKFKFDLNAGKAIGSWANPQAQSVTIKLEFNRKASDPDFGKFYIFTGDSSTDQSGYVVTFVLL